MSLDGLTLPRVIVLGGLSGSGKDTALKILTRAGWVRKGITCTTRLPRPGEINGVDYDFYTNEEFEALDAAGQMAERTRYIGNQNEGGRPIYYGITQQRIDEVFEADIPTVFILDSVGMEKMRELVPGCIGVYLWASRETLAKRMRTRGESEVTIARRLAKYYDELMLGLTHFDFNIYTENKTPEEVATLIMGLATLGAATKLALAAGGR